MLELELNEGDWDMIHGFLSNLRAEMLLFTRRLKEVKLFFDGVIDSITHRLEARIDDPNFQELRDQFKRARYFVWKHVIYDMPMHPKRENVTESQIILAFPYTDSGPVIEAQNLFAYLPLRLTSFPVRIPEISFS